MRRKENTNMQAYIEEANDALNNMDGQVPEALQDDFYEAKNAIENLTKYKDVADEAMRVLANVRDSLYASDEVYCAVEVEVFRWWDDYDALLDVIFESGLT